MSATRNGEPVVSQHVHADRQQLEPAQHAGGAAGQPDAQKRAIAQQRSGPGRAGPGIFDIGHDIWSMVARRQQGGPARKVKMRPRAIAAH